MNQEHSYPSDTDILFNEIEKGRLGLNLGLNMGYERLDSIIYGIQKGRYDLVFGKEKSGKSSFVVSSYILNPYNRLEKINKTENLKVFYFSLEMSKNSVLSKWFAHKIYEQYNILIDPNIILGRKGYLPDHIYEKLKQIKPYFDKMLNNSVSIIDEPLNPTGIKIIIDEYAKKNGKFENKTYIPNNPEQTVIIIIDTAGNLKWEKVEGLTNLKVTIDKMSEYNRYFRNKYNYTPVMVMHSNRSVDDYNREKGGDIYPKVSDIKESNQPVQDCSLCLCVFDPTPYLDRDNIDVERISGGYNPRKFNRRFRSIGILTSRDGESFLKVGMIFLGEIGKFIELPKPENIKPELYEKIKSIRKIEI